MTQTAKIENVECFEKKHGQIDDSLHAIRAIKAFERYDPSGSGRISRDALAAVLRKLCLAEALEQTQLETLLRSLWGDAMIDYREFVMWAYGKLDSESSTSRHVYMVEPHFQRRASALSESSRHLVINLDVNKTLLMKDKAGGKSTEGIVNEVLAYSAWGTVKDCQWKLSSMTPSCRRPEGLEIDEALSYSEWIGRLYPGRELRKKRSQLFCIFTRPGEPGEAMAEHAQKLLAALKNPDGSDVRLIPAFFKLLVELKRAGRSFTICFRTFGTDLEEVAQEMNCFCEGKHPLFPGVRMDGSDGGPDYRLDMSCPERCGTFFREEDCMSLVLGTLDQPGEGRYADITRSIEFYKNHASVHRIISGASQVHDLLWKMCSRCCSLGFRDYFQYWKQKHMTSEGGKLFLFDPCRHTGRHEIFFDDNIRFDDAHIVQPINRRDPDRRQWTSSLLRTHLCRAEPLHSIYDPMYFVKEVARLEESYTRKLLVRSRMARVLLAVPCDIWAMHLRSFTAAHSHDAWGGFRRCDRELPEAEDAHAEEFDG